MLIQEIITPIAIQEILIEIAIAIIAIQEILINQEITNKCYLKKCFYIGTF